MLTSLLADMDVRFLISLILFILVAGGIIFVINQDNPVEWWHFISSHTVSGEERGDIDKLGQVVGLAVSSWAIIVAAYSDHLDPFLLLAYLAYVGGVAKYASYLRAKIGMKDADGR